MDMGSVGLGGFQGLRVYGSTCGIHPFVQGTEGDPTSRLQQIKKKDTLIILR